MGRRTGESGFREEAHGHGPDPGNLGHGGEVGAPRWPSGGFGEGFPAGPGQGHGREDLRGDERVAGKRLTIALAGNANVGKSVVFNQLTGLHQHIGNWPGKTVERAEGTLHFRGYTIDIVDLPGIYSLSTYSLEEVVSREYIAVERPDLVINVVDASVLERNLFFTLQLMELGTPMVVALNQVDMAAKRGIKIDHEKLQSLLGIPVVPTVAVKGTGVYELLEKSLEVIEEGRRKPSEIKYGAEVEERIGKIAEMVEKTRFRYPARWTAIKLLEGDREVRREIGKINPKILSTVEKLAGEIARIHGHPCPTVITSERYEVASRIAREAQRMMPTIRPPMSERLHTLTTHRIFGYPVMAMVLFSAFYSIFTFGNYTSTLLNDFLCRLEPAFEGVLGSGILGNLVWGAMEGLIAGTTIALPYIFPFYLVLYILEDSGYLSRIAFLTDTMMHRIGLHGKAFIPVMLGFGCNVPGCLGCRIMETERERLLAGFVVTLVPCAATTAVILGLVGRFDGVYWALALYGIDLLIVFLLGRAAFMALPGEPTALIMEMHDYRVPHAGTVLKQTWFRLKEFIRISFPLIIVGSLVIRLIEALRLLEPIANALIPLTVNWLGLPPEMGITLIFGILRKELTIIMLNTLLGVVNFEEVGRVTAPAQRMAFTLVAMLYIPCIATIAACIKEFGWKKALFITVFKILFALAVGGLFLRALILLGVPASP